MPQSKQCNVLPPIANQSTYTPGISAHKNSIKSTKQDTVCIGLSLGAPARQPIHDIINVHDSNNPSATPHQSRLTRTPLSTPITNELNDTNSTTFVGENNDDINPEYSYLDARRNANRNDSNSLAGVCTCCRDKLHAVYSHCFAIDSTVHRDPNHDHTFSLPSPNSFDVNLHSIPSSPKPQILNLLRAPSPTLVTPMPNNKVGNQDVYVDPKLQQQADSRAFQARWKDSLLRRFGVALKDKEIHKLRTSLALEQEKKSQISNQVVNLQGALKNTLKYATKADEWQKKESSRLVQDIEDLKEQVATLMVMFIHSEEERAKLMKELETRDATIKKKDALIGQKNTEIFAQQDKLQTAYKEYLEMNSTIERLEREAIEGSGAARTRSEMLSSHLDRISRDFDTTSRSLISSQERVRQLEFELSALITQFNEAGDARHNLQKSYDEISDRFAELDAKHMQLNSQFEEATQNLHLMKEQLEAEKLQSSKLQAASSAENNILQKKLEEMTSSKAQVEGIVARMKAESEKLRASVIELRSSKSDLEATVTKLQLSYETDTSNLKKKYEEATHGKEQLVNNLSKVTEQRERLQNQVNDLRSNFERERKRANLLDTELKSLKDSSSLMKEDLETQIHQLTVSKSNLASDKNELMDTLYRARRDLIEKKVAYEDLEAKMEEWNISRKEEVTSLSATIQSQKDALTTLTSQYTTLVGNHRSLKESYDVSEKELISSQTIIKKLNDSLQIAQKQISQYEITQKNLQKSLQGERETVAEQTRVNYILEAKINTLNDEFARDRDEWARRDQNHEEMRHELETKSSQLREQVRVLSLTYDQAIAAHNRTKLDLNRTRDAVLEESAARSLLEMAVDDLRYRYDGEKRARVDYEKLGQRLQKRAAGWMGTKLDAWIEREQTWNELEIWMKHELSRLDDMITILGLEDIPSEGDTMSKQGSLSRSPSGNFRNGGGISRSRSPSARSTYSVRNSSRTGSPGPVGNRKNITRTKKPK